MRPSITTAASALILLRGTVLAAPLPYLIPKANVTDILHSASGLLQSATTGVGPVGPVLPTVSPDVESRSDLIERAVDIPGRIVRDCWDQPDGVCTGEEDDDPLRTFVNEALAESANDLVEPAGHMTDLGRPAGPFGPGSDRDGIPNLVERGGVSDLSIDQGTYS